ncbi:MAG: hypothetical protein GY804_07855 [Alphaproteobacteria bacterium]|nr:hypothetical protein [Alphaproteobacteria bacterium]
MKVFKLAVIASVICISGCSQNSYPHPYPQPNPYSRFQAQTTYEHPVTKRQELPHYSAYYDTQADCKYWANIEDGYGMQGHMGVNRGIMYPTQHWDKEERIPARW